MQEKNAESQILFKSWVKNRKIDRYTKKIHYVFCISSQKIVQYIGIH